MFEAALDRYLDQQTGSVVAALDGDGPVRPAIEGLLESLVAAGSCIPSGASPSPTE